MSNATTAIPVRSRDACALDSREGSSLLSRRIERGGLTTTGDEEDVRLRSIHDNIAARLRPVCAEWPADLFEQMVSQLARVTLKYQGVPGTTVYDRRATERLLADLKEVMDRSEAARRHTARDTDEAP